MSSRWLPQAMDVEASREIKRAAVSGATNGDNTLVAAVTGKRIKVLGLMLVVAGAVNVRLEDGAGGTALTGVMSFGAAGEGFVLPPSRPGYHYFQTTAATLLNMELSGAVQVSGWIMYYEE